MKGPHFHRFLRNRSLPVAAALAVALTLTAPAPGQDVHRVQLPSATTWQTIQDFRFVGDTDGNGTDDFVLTSNLGPTSTMSFAGVFDGITGVRLATVNFDDQAPGQHGRVYGMGDIDGDARADFAIATLPPRVRTYSGATGALIGDFAGISPPQFSESELRTVDDVDGDGVRDFSTIIGLDALIYSGATGALLRTFDGPPVGNLYCLADAGDADGDGARDFFAVTRDRRLLRYGAGPTPVAATSFPTSFTSSSFRLGDIDDTDGDGIDDVILTGGSFMVVYSSATLQPLITVTVGNGDAFITEGTAIGDVDGDGVGDIGATLGSGFGQFGLGTFRIFSGVDGSVLTSTLGPGYNFGRTVRAAGDIDGDGRADVMVDSSAGSVPPFRPNQLYVLGMRTTPGEIGLASCISPINSTGTSGKLSAFGVSDSSQPSLLITGTDLPPLTFGIAVVAPRYRLSQASPEGLCLGGTIGRLTGPGQLFQTTPQGTARVAVDMTQIPGGNGFSAVQPGDRWIFQFWHRDTFPWAATWRFTDAVTIDFR